jgi:hypothetical protein
MTGAFKFTLCSTVEESTLCSTVEESQGIHVPHRLNVLRPRSALGLNRLLEVTARANLTLEIMVAVTVQGPGADYGW